MISASPTQCDIILDALVRARGTWVAMPDLARLSGAFAIHSRISDLRSVGHKIDVRMEGGRPRKSWYRLVALAGEDPQNPNVPPKPTQSASGN